MDPMAKWTYKIPACERFQKREKNRAENLSSWSLRSFITLPSLSLLHHKVALLVNLLKVQTCRDCSKMPISWNEMGEGPSTLLLHTSRIGVIRHPFWQGRAFPKPSGWLPPVQRAQLPPWKRNTTVCYMTGNDAGYQIWLWCITSS